MHDVCINYDKSIFAQFQKGVLFFSKIPYILFIGNVTLMEYTLRQR